jgi:hypothetical protein
MHLFEIALAKAPNAALARSYPSFLIYQFKQPKEGGSPPWAGGGPDAVERSSLVK